MIDFSQDPFEIFDQLFKEAQLKKVPEANAMTLATVDKDNQPSARIVYLKRNSPEGFVFYGNYNSYKAQGIQNESKVCLNFFWPELWQQVRIYGVASQIPEEESDAYFATRARLSQIGAWASLQSQTIPSTQWLSDRVNEFESKFKDQAVPRPPHWGGYNIVPHQIEFWFGLEGRLHERYIFTRENSSVPWTTSMKSP